MAAEESSAREPGGAELRRRIAELEAENAELRRARRAEVELKATRAALRESEARHRLVVESATDYAIFTTDLGRRVTSWNAGAERVLGWPEEEILGRSADAIFTPEDREAGMPEREARAALEEGRAEDVRWHLHRDGSRLWGSGVMLTLRDDAGATTGLLKILRDKTAEKRAGDELRERAGFVERVLESSADRIEVLDLEGRLLFLSAGGLSALEIDDLGTVRGRPWVELWPAEAADAARAAVATARAGGAARFRGSAPTAKGAPRWWDAQVTPIPGEDGRPERLLAISRDITEQRRAGERLRESEAHAAALAAERAAVLDQLAEGVIVTDPAGQIVFVNDAAARIHGAASLGVPPEAYSRTYGLHAEDGRPYPPAELPLARAVLRGETVTEARWRIRRPDGTEVLAVGSARPVLAPDGARTGAVLTLRDETARDAAERALRASEERFRGVFDQQFQFMAVLSPEGVTLEINGLPLRAAGLARDQVVGRLFWETPFWAGLPAMRAAWPSRLAEAARAAGPVLSEDRYQTSGGEVRAADAAVTAVRGPEGDVRFFVIQATDVTERMRAEAALREGAGRLRALADNLPSGMVYQVAMRPDGSGRRFVYLAQSCERLTGVPAEAALADPGALYGAIYPEDRPGLAAAEEAAIRDLAPFEFEARLVRADTGEVRWCRLASAPREVPDGSLVWDGLLVDVTEQRAAEEALREEAHSLEVLNRTGALLAAELDLGRLVQAVTDAATELSGAAFGAFFYNTAGARGEALTLYALSGAPRSAFERFPLPRGTAVFGPTLRGEGVVRSHDITADPRYGRNAPHRGMPEGHLPVRSYLAVPVASRPGEVLGALFFGHPEPGVFAERAERLVAGVAAQAAIAIDNSRLLQAAQREVAARAAAEAELRRLNETLEERVRERTRALEAEAAERERAEEQLRQAQKMEAVGQLTGGIAHDFNNLLTGIVGALAILQRRVDAGRTQGLERYTGAAITSAQRAAALTQRLLAFARSQPLDPKPVDANRLVAGMEDLLRRTLGPAIGLEMVLAGGLWPTLCDPNQLESAILNLAINARDAMPEGGRLTVETANAHLDEAYARAQGGEVEPGQYVAVCVTDTGTGMAPEVAERAFEPFFTTKPLGKGTGLGLSMLYGFVKQSGGHVRVYSEVGRGTTFKLYLARHRGSLETSETGARPGGAPRADAGETVLVVEDEPTVRMLILETLEELGYAAIEAADGPSGLRVLQSDARVDLLVTDVGLPGLDGRQLADAARRAKPGLKVLFITGYAHNAAVGNGVLEPGMEMLTKPFAMDALADKIRSMIDKA